MSALVIEVSRVAEAIKNARLRMEDLRNSEKSVATDTWCCETLIEGQIDKKYADIAASLQSSLVEIYKPVLVNSFLPQSAIDRFRFLRDLKRSGFTCKEKRVCLFTHTYKNNIESLHFMWMVEDDPDEQRRAQRHCEDQVPKYHSRFLKRKFSEVADMLDVRPCKARLLYQLATDDASAARTLDEALVDKRLQEFVNMKDESIVYDLRALNKSQEVYSTFFNKAEDVINAEVGLAVDDRRHDQVVHLAKAMSVEDLYKLVNF